MGRYGSNRWMNHAGGPRRKLAAGAVVLWALTGCEPSAEPAQSPDLATAPSPVPEVLLETPRREPAGPRPPNVLLLLADDVGIDLIDSYGVHSDAPPTPNLDRLAAEGVRFTNAYAMPWCSPTRAGILTGRNGHRYGFGRAIAIGSASQPSLPDEEVTLAELLRDDAPWSWEMGLAGKWHLTTKTDHAATAALRHGFHHHYGTMGNLYARHAVDRKDQDHYDWERVVDGEVARCREYTTTVNVDDALTLSRQLRSPWLLWVAFQVAHDPFQPPPDHLHSYGNLEGATVSRRYRAVVEAMDREIGRLFSEMDPDVLAETLVVFVGDNGTDRRALTSRWSRHPGKGTVHETGIRVPLIVRGPPVAHAGSTCAALVHTNDLFATILDLASLPVAARPEVLDSHSFLPLLQEPDGVPTRQTVYTEQFRPNGPGPYAQRSQSIRDERYKLIVEQGKRDALYDLSEGLVEGRDLLQEPTRPVEVREAYARLRSQLRAIAPK